MYALLTLGAARVELIQKIEQFDAKSVCKPQNFEC